MLSHPHIAISLRTHVRKENQPLANEQLKAIDAKGLEAIIKPYSKLALTFPLEE